MHSTEQLAVLVRRKHQVLTQLREAARRQAVLVSGGNTTALLGLLATKQELIAALQAVERTLTPYYAEDPDKRAWSSAQERAACAKLATECNAMLEEIVQMEKTGAEQMAARRNDVAEQLRRVHSAAQVRGAYEAQRMPRPS
jgi:hypothetical protein